MKHPIPDAALDDRLFFGGTAGSGKTYNAGSRVERLLARQSRVVIPDPLGVWWGLRLAGDGKTPSGYDVVIFGGPHGDLPLTEHAGALIGETIAGMKESCILDLSELGTKASERRFMLSFLTALHKHATGEPLHVVFDEADMWAPQRLLDKEGEAAKLLGMMETIVRRGRVKGFIPWLISQRPAVISKDVMSQADGIVAFKLTSSQDRDAIGDWVKGQADLETWKAIWASLPTMERGQGVVWIPGRNVLNTVQFPEKETFDSSRTPKRGEKQKAATALKPLDLGALRERLAKVEAVNKANDPKALRTQLAAKESELAQLRRQMEAAAKQKVVADPDAIIKAEERGFERAKAQLTAAAERHAQEAHLNTVEVLKERLVPVMQMIEDDLRRAKATKVRLAPAVTYTPAASSRTGAISRPRAVPAPPPSADGDSTYTRPQIRVLQSLAMWRSLGHDAPSREMVAAAAGYRPSSGGFNNLLGGLATAGAISKPSPGHLSLAREFEVVTREEGRSMLLASLSAPQKKIIAALLNVGSRSRDQVGDDTGYSASSGGFNNLLGSLTTLGIIVKPQQGYVALSDWAQELLEGSTELAA